MTFTYNPGGSHRGLEQPEPAISAAAENVEQLRERGVHPARVPRPGLWHPASARARQLEAAAKERDEAPAVEEAPAQEEETLSQAGRFAKVPGDLAEHILERAPLHHREVGADATLQTNRFGQHRILAADGGSLHPGLRGDASMEADTRGQVWGKNQRQRDAVEKIKTRYGSRGYDENAWPIASAEPEPAPEAKPREASDARRIANAIAELTELSQKNPALARAVFSHEIGE